MRRLIKKLGESSLSERRLRCLERVGTSGTALVVKRLLQAANRRFFSALACSSLCGDSSRIFTQCEIRLDGALEVGPEGRSELQLRGAGFSSVYY